MKSRVAKWKHWAGAALAFAVMPVGSFGEAAPAAAPPNEDVWISTGDNHWLENALPVDSPATIDATFRLFKAIGVRRVYWRGVEEAAWMDTIGERAENPLYYSDFTWTRWLFAHVDPNRLAAAAARKYGLELWGVSTLGDWGSQADVPCFNDWPFEQESRLRTEHPEWVPVDRYGILRQGGPIDLSYPEARKALIDLHMKFMKREGYAGLAFVTYVENYSMRFQDEFGFNDPVIQEFEKRYHVNLRTDDFTRGASRADWSRLRGEYLTDYFRELKAELAKNGQKLGVFLDPHELHQPEPWNVPELMRTYGSCYLDLETWVREGIVDQFGIWGYCAPSLQDAAVEDMLWMTRATPVRVGLLTSSPQKPDWASLRRQGAQVVMSAGDSPEEIYLIRSAVPRQTLAGLKSSAEVLWMMTLAEIAVGDLHATVGDLQPFAADPNPLTRRLALKAMAETGDAAAIPIVENALNDPETAVRCTAISSLQRLNPPDAAEKILETVAEHPNHPTREVARHALQAIAPVPYGAIVAYIGNPEPEARATALMELSLHPLRRHVPLLVRELDDSDQYARYLAAVALGNVIDSTGAVQALIAALRHPDPVVDNRAATSLRTVLERGDRTGASLRESILAGLESLYRQSGKDSRRPDRDWSYRPVGNALLAAGPEGAIFLQSLIDQTVDQPLAERAWKSLYIRQDERTFSEVTEKENEEAFRHRPEFLKTIRKIRLENGFDQPKPEPGAGGRMGIAGHWGPFSAGRASIAADISLSAPDSLKLSDASILAGIDPGITDGNDYEVDFATYRGPGASLAVQTESGPRAEAALRIDGRGGIWIGNGDGRWIESGAEVPEQTWTLVRITVNRLNRRLTVQTGAPGGSWRDAPVQGGIVLQPAVRALRFAASGVDHIDDVQWVEKP